MGKYIDIAKGIASALLEGDERRKISVNDLIEIVASIIEVGERNLYPGGRDSGIGSGSGIGVSRLINLYPGVPGDICHDLALFISLSSPAYVKSKGKHGHLSCEQAIEKIVQHMQGKCINRTRDAVLVTDSWEIGPFHEWEANLHQIAKTALLEIYLIVGRNVTQIQI